MLSNLINVCILSDKTIEWNGTLVCIFLNIVLGFSSQFLKTLKQKYTLSDCLDSQRNLFAQMTNMRTYLLLANAIDRNMHLLPSFHRFNKYNIIYL